MAYRSMLFILFWFVVYLFIATISGAFLTDSSITIYSAHYLITLMTLLLGTSIFYFKSKSYLKDSVTLPRELVLGVGALVVLAILSVCVEFGSRGVWLDEFTQFNGASCIGVDFCQIASFAAIEQQPPLDYYLSSFSHLVFGASPFAVRFHAMMYSILSIALTPIICFHFCRKKLLSLISGVLLLSSTFFRFYSVEARPLLGAIFFGLLFFFFYWDYLFKDRKRIFLIPVVTSQVLFSLSIGFQPIVMIISCFFGSLVLLREKRQVVIDLFCTNLVSAVLFIPHLINIFKASYELNQFNDRPFGRLLDLLLSFEPQIVLAYFDYSYMYAGLVLILIVLGVLAAKKNNVFNVTLSLALTVFAFPILFTVLYLFFINWPLSGHYHIVYLPVVSIFPIIIFSSFFDIFNKKRVRIGGGILILAILLVTIFRVSNYSEEKRQFAHSQSKINEMYHYISENSSAKDVLVYSIFSLLGHHRGAVPVALSLYINNEENSVQHYLSSPINPSEFPILHIPEEKISVAPSSQLFWAVWNQQNKLDLGKLLGRVGITFSTHHFGDYDLYQIHGAFRDGMNSYYQMLDSFLVHMPERYSSMILETLIARAIELNDREGAAQYLKRYREIDLGEDRSFFSIDIQGIRRDNVLIYQQRIGAIDE